MSTPITVHGLFETHLTVRDLDRSIAFYRDLVGLRLALHERERGAAFFWIGAPGQSMLGLWAAGSVATRDLASRRTRDIARRGSRGSQPVETARHHTALIPRRGGERAERDRLDARGSRLLSRPRRSFARVPRDARRATGPRSRHRQLVGVVFGGRPVTRAGPLSLTVIAATSWAAATVLTKVALRELAPLDLLGIELFSSAIAMVCLLAARGRPLLPRNWPVFAALGMLEPGLSFGLFDFGLSRTGAADGALLIASQSLFGVLLARILLGERVSPMTRAAVAVGFAGSALVGLAETGHGTSLIGDLLVLAASAAAASNGVGIRRISAEADNLAATTTQLVAAALLVAPVIVIATPARSRDSPAPIPPTCSPRSRRACSAAPFPFSRSTSPSAISPSRTQA